MPDLPISGLSAETALVATDQLVVNNGGTTKRVTALLAAGNEWQMPPPNGTDDTTALQAVWDAIHSSSLVNATCKWQPGTYIATALTFYGGIRNVGAGTEATILQLKNGTNSTTTALLTSLNFGTLTGTNSTAGVHGHSFENMTIDGNKANNGSMTVPLIRRYGYGGRWGPALVIRNGKNEGLYSEWATSAATPGQDSMEDHISMMKVHDCDSHNIHWLGPHDTDWTEGESYQSAARNIFVDSNANATGAGFKCTNVHAWGTNSTHAWYWNAAQCSNANCVGEGASTVQLAINANDCAWVGGTIFGGVAGVKGIKIGDTTLVNGTHLDVHIVSCTGGSIDFNNEGMSLVVANIYQASGTVFTGTPAANTTVIAPVNGQAGQGIFQFAGAGAAGVAMGTSFANFLAVFGAAAAATPSLQATGSDTNVNMNLATKGTGEIVLTASLISSGGGNPTTSNLGTNVSTATVAGNNTRGVVTITAGGTLITAPLRICTITFNASQPHLVNVPRVQVTNSTTGAADATHSLSVYGVAAEGFTTFDLWLISGNINASAVVKVDYWCLE